MIESRGGRIAAVAAALLPIGVITLGLPGALPTGPDPLSTTSPQLCLFCGYSGTADFVLNIALFLPFGAALRLSGFRARTAALIALALSLGIETAQLAIPGRYTTLGDLAANALGGGLGALLAATGPLSLRAPSSLRRQAALTLAVAGVWLGTVATYGLSLPTTAYYGQWTAELGQYENYRGEVLEATIGGHQAPSWRLPPEVRAREALLAGDTVAVTAIAGPPPPGPAPIFSIFDDRQEEILFLGADGSDLLLKVRRRAADLRFARPQLRWRDALAGVEAGDTLGLAVWRHGRTGMCVRLEAAVGSRPGSPPEARERCRAPRVSEGWMLLLGPERVPSSAWPVLNALWVAGWAVVALAWAPGLGAGVVGAGVLTLVWAAGAGLR